MITASHQTFSDHLWHLTDQTKFDQTNLLCIINGEVNKFTIGKQMSGQFSTLIISTVASQPVGNYATPFGTRGLSFLEIVYEILKSALNCSDFKFYFSN